MPRRIYTYEPGRGWDIWNLIVTIGVVLPGRRHPGLRRQSGLVVLPRRGCRKRSVGRVDAGVVHEFAAARIQLRRRFRRAEPPPAVGPQASGRSGLEVRVRSETMSVTRPSPCRISNLVASSARGTGRNVLPDRGRVGDLHDFRGGLPFLHRQEPHRADAPNDVLSVPIFFTICLLSSSLTIHFAVNSSDRREITAFGLWWLSPLLLGATFLFGTAREWHHLIYDEGLTISTNLFGTTYYSLVGLHAFHVTVGLLGAGHRVAFSRSVRLRQQEQPSASRYCRCTGISSTRSGCGVHGGLHRLDAEGGSEHG